MALFFMKIVAWMEKLDRAMMRCGLNSQKQLQNRSAPEQAQPFDGAIRKFCKGFRRWASPRADSSLLHSFRLRRAGSGFFLGSFSALG